MSQQMDVNKDELKNKLTDEQFHVTQEGGTEAPFSGKYYDTTDKGKYNCVVCGAQLFNSDTKIDHAKYEHKPGLAGWPSFDEALPGAVEYKEDTSHGMRRTEIVCASCGAHLGHVFDDPEEKTNKHFCVNSCALNLQKDE